MTGLATTSRASAPTAATLAAADTGMRLDAAAIAALIAGWDEHRPYGLGYPAAEDLDCTSLEPVLTRLLNNAGDPFAPPGPYPMQTLTLERQVIDHVAELLRAPAGRYHGYVTGGGTEATIAALRAARRALPEAIVITSRAAHYSVAKAADLLRVPLVQVDTDPAGELDYAALSTAVKDLVGEHGDAAAVIVVANIGTTMTEAADDVRRILAVLADAGVPADRRWVHADAALAGLPLATLDPAARPGFDVADGAHSVMFTGHKFLGLPTACAVLVIAPGVHAHHPGAHVPYIGSRDATISGSRSGHTTLMFAHAFTVWTTADLRRRAEQARDLAAYATQRLAAVGVPAWRHRHAFTVVFPTPPQAVIDRWGLPVHDHISHIVCMPGRTRQQVDAFIADLRAARLGLPLPSLTIPGSALALVVPRPRTSPEANPC